MHMSWNREWILKEKYNFLENKFVCNSQPQKQLGSGFDMSEGKQMTFFFLIRALESRLHALYTKKQASTWEKLFLILVLYEDPRPHKIMEKRHNKDNEWNALILYISQFLHIYIILTFHQHYWLYIYYRNSGIS